jgi:hypothetical protein
MPSRLFRLLIPALAALLLAGCWGASAPPPPRQSVISRFVTGSPDQITATITDPLPVKTALLKMPDGRTVAAQQIDKERNVYNERGGYYGGPGFGVGVAGGSNGGVSSGIGFGIPLGGGGYGGTRSHSMTTSTVKFKVPDMAAYRRDWQQWVLHVELDDGANRRTIETLPPAPPQE